MSDEFIIIKQEEEPIDFMGKLGKVMSDPKFKVFFGEYFQDWSNVKTAIMLMKTYSFIEEEYYKRTGLKMESEEVINILKKMISDKECRHLIVEEMGSFMAEKNKFLEYYRQIFPNLLTNK